MTYGEEFSSDRGEVVERDASGYGGRVGDHEEREGEGGLGDVVDVVGSVGVG